MSNWNHNRLHEIALRDRCSFLPSALAEFNECHEPRNFKLSFKCSCGEEARKSFRMLWEYKGGFCKECIAKQTDKDMTNSDRDVSNVVYTLEQSGKVTKASVQEKAHYYYVDNQVKVPIILRNEPLSKFWSFRSQFNGVYILVFADTIALIESCKIKFPMFIRTPLLRSNFQDCLCSTSELVPDIWTQEYCIDTDNPDYQKTLMGLLNKGVNAFVLPTKII